MDEDDNEDDYVRPRLYSLKKEFAIKVKRQSRESRIQHTSITTTSENESKSKSKYDKNLKVEKKKI